SQVRMRKAHVHRASFNPLNHIKQGTHMSLSAKLGTGCNIQASGNPHSVRPAHSIAKRTALLLLLLALSTLVGCKTPQIYHSADSVVAGPGTNFHTAFIEFDDQGELWEPQQIKNAVQAIKTNNPVF